MDKRKKTILIAIISVILIAVIAISIFLIIKLNPKDDVSKLERYYDKLKESNGYSFSAFLNDANSMKYTRKNDKAYIDSTYKGRNSKYIIKDGNTYLVKDSDKSYYTYTNNVIELYKVELQFKNMLDNEVTVGKEKIDNTSYKYEEFTGITSFYFDSLNENIEESNVKTRFYFDKNNNLVYIRTIIDENTNQLVKVEYTDDSIDENLFEIPSDYEKM